MTADEIYAIEPDRNGWRILPNGNRVTLGDGVTLGDWVTLGNRVTSSDLAEQFRQLWRERGEVVKFTKWLTKNRMSPNFDGGTSIEYKIGERITVDNAVANDQQCTAGLHVLEYGHRPEWYGLCEANHDYLAITVEVRTEDILFGGLPTMTGKYRVRSLMVLN